MPGGSGCPTVRGGRAMVGKHKSARERPWCLVSVTAVERVTLSVNYLIYSHNASLFSKKSARLRKRTRKCKKTEDFMFFSIIPFNKFNNY